MVWPFIGMKHPQRSLLAILMWMAGGTSLVKIERFNVLWVSFMAYMDSLKLCDPLRFMSV